MSGCHMENEFQKRAMTEADGRRVIAKFIVAVIAILLVLGVIAFLKAKIV